MLTKFDTRHSLPQRLKLRKTLTIAKSDFYPSPTCAVRQPISPCD
jgi:hypothetical protein